MKVNWVVLAIAFCYGMMETGYFGWNTRARSDAEMICDGITLLIAALAFGSIGDAENHNS